METNSTQVTTSTVGLRYGLLAGIVSILISFALFATQMEQSPLQHVWYLVLAVAMVLAMLFFKQQNQGFLNFGEGVRIGVIVAAVLGALSALFAYVYLNVIAPEAVERMMEKARADMEARGSMSDEQIEQGMAMAGKFMNGPLMIGVVLLWTVLVGVIFALVISAIVKHSKPEFE